MQQLPPARLAIIAAVFVAAIALDALGHDATQPLSDGPISYAPSDIAITLERTPCFGTCPVYTVTIDGLGRVTYEGRQHVMRTGRQRGTIKMEEVETLLNEFLRARFMHALDEYRTRDFVKLEDGQYRRLGEGMSDLPSAILTLTLGSRTKRVLLHHSFPAELGRLPDLVDISANTEQWTGRPRSVPQRPPGA